MLQFNWLTSLTNKLRANSTRRIQARRKCSRHHSFRVSHASLSNYIAESLEDRTLLTTFTVVNTNDSGEGSLREAIEQANANAGADIIKFDFPSLVGQTIVLTDELLISDDLTIIGLDADQLTIDGNYNSRIFNIDDGSMYSTISVEISGLTLTHGYADNGGAIFNNEILSISNSMIAENEATQNGGGIYHSSHGHYVQNMTISSTTFFRNVAAGNGGGVYGTLGHTGLYHTVVTPIQDLADPSKTVYRYSSEPTYNFTSISNSHFIENSAHSGGGIFKAYSLQFHDWCGTPVVSSSATIVTRLNVIETPPKTGFSIIESTFSGNTAENGGGIFNSDGLMEIRGNSIQNNSATDVGGGIFNLGDLIIEESTILENTAAEGGGIRTSSGNITIMNSTLTNNTATYYGGGVSSQGHLSLINSTVSGNRSGIKGGGIFQYSGGYLLHSYVISLINGAIDTNRDTNIEPTFHSLKPSNLRGNTNYSFRTAASAIDTSATHLTSILDRPSSLIITNSTITGNIAAQSGGGIASPPDWNEFTISTITNSIVAGNTAASFFQIIGNFTSNTSIIQDSVEGLLDPVLRDNGGPTKTHALVTGSAAINAGNNEAALSAELTNDQRGTGYERIFGETVDIGAFEFQTLIPLVDFKFVTGINKEIENLDIQAVDSEADTLPGPINIDVIPTRTIWNSDITPIINNEFNHPGQLSLIELFEDNQETNQSDLWSFIDYELGQKDEGTMKELLASEIRELTLSEKEYQEQDSLSDSETDEFFTSLKESSNLIAF
ncbi:choice-of-anchor Q domain-containing protein [Gimesia aquarii]|uniref:Uncharacterized protein n=1 Tax=Gimesia aquarii TaxID=2527964 RepID=A0A517X020_9PLAN|nr:choice-of-anchor Q domain-containing protein [Gimesia aquarii]QDU10849.1 hypothetical protein V202x_42620 [Gimesia aquarii]